MRADRRHCSMKCKRLQQKFNNSENKIAEKLSEYDYAGYRTSDRSKDTDTKIKLYQNLNDR